MSIGVTEFQERGRVTKGEKSRGAAAFCNPTKEDDGLQGCLRRLRSRKEPEQSLSQKTGAKKGHHISCYKEVLLVGKCKITSVGFRVTFL